MRITLVNADFPSETAVPPLGLLSLAQAAEADGHIVSLRDYQLARVKGSRDPTVFADFCRTPDQVLGVSVSGFALPLVILGLKELKRSRPDLITILGGIGASGSARQIMTAFPWMEGKCWAVLRPVGRLLMCPDCSTAVGAGFRSMENDRASRI